MGYSQSNRSAVAYTMVFAFAFAEGHVAKDAGTNAWTYGGVTYFEERGRENADGAYTGSVMKMLPGGFCRKAGSVRIDADGKIVRWTGMPPSVLKDARDEMTRRPVLGMAQLYEYQDAMLRAHGMAS